MRKQLSTLLFATLASIGTLFAEGGSCGENLTWNLTNGVLTISGTGAMTNYTSYASSTASWYSQKSSINSVVINDGVTSIGEFAFFDCTGLTSIINYATIPQVITQNVFAGVNADASILYVPFESAAAYQSANIWSMWNEYGNIRSIENVISVAEALAIGKKLEVGKSTQEQYTIRGYVSYTDPYRPFDEQSGTQCFNIADDISAAAYSLETGGFYVYLGKPNTGKALKGGEYVEFTTSIYRYKENVIENRAQNITVTVLKEAPECRVFKGACGENLTWTLDCKGHLVISGTGAMYNYEKGAAPWCQYDVSVVTIENGVTSLGKYAFYRCSMDSIFISASVNRIAFNTFNNSFNLQNFEVAQDNSVFCSVEGVLFNKSRTKIVRFPRGRSGEYVIPEGVEIVGAGAFNGCTEVTSVIMPTSVVTIDYAAFFACNMQSVTIPSHVDSIGIVAFGACPLTSVINYAVEPQKLHSDSIAFEDVDLSACTLYVPAQSVAAYKAAYLWKDFGNIQAIEAEDVTEPVTTVQTTPQDNAVTITWPVSAQADTYEIDIYKNGVLVCRLTFSADGRLLGIAFAPAIKGAHNAAHALLTTTGWQFTITNLESGTKYDYTVTAKKLDETPAYSQSGTFTTTGTASSIEQIANDKMSKCENEKIIIGGQIFILRDGKIYSVQGQEVK